MKQTINHRLFVLASCLSIIILFNACSSAKEIISVATPEEITQAINNDHWKFSPNYVTPSYGSSRNLTSEYFVTTNNNKLVVALPYFGKLNSPAGAMNGNPLDFTSTNFNLTKETNSKGGWTVTIKNPDTEVQSMVFTFYDNGSAQLMITMTNRTGISYSGSVAPTAPQA
jgi:hypothetical protein